MATLPLTKSQNDHGLEIDTLSDLIVTGSAYDCSSRTQEARQEWCCCSPDDSQQKL